jgi:hypothetical protein
MHMISDEELELLKVGGRESSTDWALAAGGAGVGFGQNLINAGYSVYTNAAPELTEFALGLCSAILLSAAVVGYFTSRHVGSSLDTLVEAVKNRPKNDPGV